MQSHNPEDSVKFLDFATVADQVGSTTRRTEKAAFLGAFFSRLSEDDLQIAARFFAGHIFPLWDQRTTNVGGAALFAGITAVTGLDRDTLYARLVPLGDLGDLAHETFTGRRKSGGQRSPLTLANLGAAFERLAATGGSKLKTALVIELLGGASPLEAKYLVKLLIGDLRVGLKEGSVEDAIARLAAVKVAAVQWANMLTGDIGETALLARRNQLDQASMRLFHPIKFMLATPAADLQDVARRMPQGFLVEDKFDGIRAQAHVQAGRVAIYSRTMDEITHRFPELIGPLESLKTDVIIDGEIVPANGDVILPFSELQKRLGRKNVGPQLLSAVPVVLVAYDLLYAAGN